MSKQGSRLSIDLAENCHLLLKIKCGKCRSNDLYSYIQNKLDRWFTDNGSSADQCCQGSLVRDGTLCPGVRGKDRSTAQDPLMRCLVASFVGESYAVVGMNERDDLEFQHAHNTAPIDSRDSAAADFLVVDGGCFQCSMVANRWLVVRRTSDTDSSPGLLNQGVGRLVAMVRQCLVDCLAEVGRVYRGWDEDSDC